MKIAFITECDYEISCEETENSDLIIFPFFGGKPVSYNREIKGETNFFKTLTNISKSLKTTVIAGVDTDSYGAVRHSVAVCSKGKLLGISDMNFICEGEKYVGGGGYRVYDSPAGRIGVAVGSDGFFSDSVRTLSQCGADVIVNVCSAVLDSNASVSARAKAFEFGVPVAVCADKCAMLALPDGNMAFTSPKKVTVFSVRTDRYYSSLTVKRRGKKFKYLQ